jgi:hypothetical protein
MKDRALLVIIAVYVALALAYAGATPRWQNPDEPAHYNYARQIADQARLPVLSAGDYDQDALERLKASKFAGNPDVSAIRYESYQPPLYYALGGLVIAVTPGVDFDLHAMRLLSIVLGVLVLATVYAIGRAVAPGDALVALGATALVAFNPQHIAVTTAANNDVLGELLLALMTLLAIRRAGGMSRRRFVAAGAALLGLAFLTKVTAYTGVVLLAVGEIAWWARYSRGERFAENAGDEGLRSSLAALVTIIGGALLISGWWFVRNALVYGGMDVLGTARHDLVVVGQPRTLWGLDALRHFVVTTFQSFWGVFGWMGAPIDVRLYWLLALVTGLALVGLAILAARRLRSMTAAQGWTAVILALQLALIAGVMVVYNLSYIQPQGRYLFPANAAIAVLLALGWREMVGRPYLLTLLTAAGGVALWLIVGGAFFAALGGAAAVAILAAWFLARPWYRRLLWGSPATALAALAIVCLTLFIVPALAA